MKEIEIINESGNKSVSLEELYKAFYEEQSAVEHRFRSNSSTGTEACDHCGINYSQQTQFHEMTSLLYPSFVNGVEFFNNTKDILSPTKASLLFKRKPV